MSGAQLHLLLNHVPILGSIFAVLLLLYGMLRRSAEVKRLALLTSVIVALLTIPAYRSGPSAARELRGVPTVSRDDIEAHEEMAEKTYLVIELTGALALIGLIAAWRRGPEHEHDPHGWAVIGVLVLGLASAGLASWTGHLGGLIRHPELRGGALAAPAPTATPPAAPR